jgi:hypothetical protein
MKAVITITEKKIEIRCGRKTKRQFFTRPEHQRMLKIWLGMLFKK